MNNWIGHGFTGKDTEIKTLESGKKIAKFTLATQSYRKDKDGNKMSHTEWHTIVVWDKLAELCEKYVKKGSELIVTGEVTYRDYTDKDGVKKYFTEIIGNSIEFCGKKEAESKPENNEGKSVKQNIVDQSKANAGQNEDDLPF